MLNIYKSRESIDKEKFIYSRIKEEKVRTIVIVPDQYTLAAERQAMDRMETEVLLDVEITGISRLGSRLIEEVGGERKATVINQYGRHMLISKILRELDDDLSAFKGYSRRESFIEAINDFISAAKQHEVSPESLKLLASDLVAAKDSVRPGNIAFYQKLHDLALIFEKYQEKLSGKYTDNEDLIDLYIGAASKSKAISKSKIWVYGFDSFTPKNRKFILALAERALELNLHLIYDDNSRDEDLFTLSKLMADSFSDAAIERGIQIKHIPVKNNSINQRDVQDSMADEKAPALRYLERELFAVGKSTYEDAGEEDREKENKESIQIIKCANPYREAEAAAAHVLNLLREKNYRYSDIVMICNDQEARGAIISRVFSEYGKDIFDDKKRDALGSPVAIYILSLLEILAFNYRTPDVMRLLKTGLTNIPDEEIYELENYASKYKIRGTMWRSPFARGLHERRYEDGVLDQIEETRKKLIALIEPIGDIYNEAKTYGEFAEKYLDRLMGAESVLAEKLQDLISRQEAAGLFEQAEATGQMWEVIQGIFAQIAEIMDDEPFDGEDFAKLLRSGLSQLEVGVLPPTADDILLGTMQRTRSGDCKAMLVIGANDNLIPRTEGENLLFSREELEFLSDEDRSLGIDANLRLMEENLAIYRNLSKPTEELWISYSETDQQGNELRPSEIVNSIKQVFPNITEQSDADLAIDISNYIGGKTNTIRRYTELKRGNKGPANEVARDSANVAVNEAAMTIESWIEDSDDELLKRVNRALRFDNVQVPLPEELASGLYGRYVNNAGETVYKFSPTSLERYSRCPFSYFVGYGLSPEELRADQVGPRDIGELYHNVLQRFAQEIGEANRWSDVTKSEADDIVERLAEEWAGEYRSKLFEKPGSETYRYNRAIRACKYIAWTLVEQARAGAIKESYFETEFAPGKSEDAADTGDSPNTLRLEPIVKKMPNGEAIIQGKIDRVDILADDRVKIIDYKTGKEKFDVDEVRAGYRLQLMLYLQAAQNRGEKEAATRKPAGVFYFLISEPEFDISEGNESKLRDAYRMEGMMIEDESVIREIAGDIYDDAGMPLPSSSSGVVKLKRKKDGSLDNYSAKRLMSESEFGELQNTVDMIASRLCTEIAEGRIDLTPKKSGNKSPCEYCEYHSICRFDTIFPGCKYELV